MHSHEHFYQTGSKQQQITLYPHLDSNNKWLIEPYNGTIHNETFVPLINGMKIRLKHINTGRRLHSHDENLQLVNVTGKGMFMLWIRWICW